MADRAETATSSVTEIKPLAELEESRTANRNEVQGRELKESSPAINPIDRENAAERYGASEPEYSADGVRVAYRNSSYNYRTRSTEQNIQQRIQNDPRNNRASVENTWIKDDLVRRTLHDHPELREYFYKSTKVDSVRSFPQFIGEGLQSATRAQELQRDKLQELYNSGLVNEPYLDNAFGYIPGPIKHNYQSGYVKMAIRLGIITSDSDMYVSRMNHDEGRPYIAGEGAYTKSVAIEAENRQLERVLESKKNLPGMKEKIAEARKMIPESHATLKGTHPFMSADQKQKVEAENQEWKDDYHKKRIEEERRIKAEAKEESIKNFIQDVGNRLKRGESVPQNLVKRYVQLTEIDGREGVSSHRADTLHAYGLKMEHEILRVDNVPKMEGFEFRLHEKALIERGQIAQIPPTQMTSFLNMLGNQYAAEHRQRFMNSGLHTYDGGTPGDNTRLGILLASEALSEYGSQADRKLLEQHVWNQGPMNRYGFTEEEMAILFKGNEQSKEEETIAGDGLVALKKQSDAEFQERLYENYKTQAQRYLNHPNTKPEYFDKYIENLETAVAEGNLTSEQLQEIKDMRKMVPDNLQVDKLVMKPEITVTPEQFDQAKSIASSARHLLDMYREMPIQESYATHALTELKRRLKGSDPVIKEFLLEQLQKHDGDTEGYAYQMEPDTRKALFQFFTDEPSAALQAIELAPPRLPSLDEMKENCKRFDRIVKNSHDKTSYSLAHIAEQIEYRASMLPKEELKKLRDYINTDLKNTPQSLFSFLQVQPEILAANKKTAAA